MRALGLGPAGRGAPARSPGGSRALGLNLAVIIVSMLPFGGWQDIVSVMGDIYLIVYPASAVAVAAFRAHDRERGLPLAGRLHAGGALDRTGQFRRGERVRLLVGMGRPAASRRTADLPQSSCRYGSGCANSFFQWLSCDAS
ncbi:hypothetical protein EDD95_6034 [Streptomyces sp. CEV 2-1]|nr:hypothetical protein EDD95_6034 [Streptomyces sp. CEV 2-1]